MEATNLGIADGQRRRCKSTIVDKKQNRSLQMKTFSKKAAQGEISISKIARLPTGVRAMTAENGQFVIGHSESGHNHVLTLGKAKVFESTDAPAGMRILYAILEEPNALIHERSFDTHEPISLPAGVYEFRVGREFDPYAELARRQVD
jgi:hypothetical protein